MLQSLMGDQVDFSVTQPQSSDPPPSPSPLPPSPKKLTMINPADSVQSL